MSALYVVKVGSATLDRGEIFAELAALRERGARVLLIAGGAVGIERYYDSIGRPMPIRTMANGDAFRYCPPEEMPFVVTAYEQVTLPSVEAGFAALGLSVFTSVAARGGLVSGTPNKPIRAVSDAGRTAVIRDHRAGVPSTVDVEKLTALLDTYDIVCLSPPVAGDDGVAPLNVDADVLAAAVSNAMHADHLRLVTGTPGLLRDPDDAASTLRDLYPGEGKQYAGGRMRQKVRAAEMALAGSGDVAITGPHTMADDSLWTRFWPEAPPADDLTLLGRTVGIPSVSRDEHELARFLARWCTDRGIDAHVDEAGNLVAVKGSGDRRLLLLGHLDTVPFHWPARWEPEGTLFGRGSVDAKGCLASFLEVLEQVEVPEDGQVRVVGAVEEEISSSKGAFFVRDNYPADAVVVGEPSGTGKLTLGYFGLFKLRVAVTVASGHSAGMDVVSAPDRLIRALGDIRESVLKEAPDALSAVIDMWAEPGREANRAVGVLNFRVPPGADLELLRETALAHVSDEVAIEPQRATPGFSGGRATPLAKSFIRAFAANEVKPRFVVKKGTSDMNTLATTWTGVPMVAYGPGDSTLDHTDVERIGADEYRQARTVLGAAVRNWFTITGDKS